MADERRPYRLQRRAESQRQTRLRLTESAVTLHGTVGPSLTTMSAVAQHAGVRRSTLYRHFSDEAALFDACTAHWASENPLPDLGAWLVIDNADKRLGVALGELYTFYERTERMLENMVRDEQTMPLVAERFAAVHAYVDAAQDTLMADRKLRGGAKRRTRAAIGHAISFSTWKSLVREQHISATEAIALMCSLVGGGARAD